MPKFDDKTTASRLQVLYSQEEERLVQTMAPQYGYEYINLRGYTMNPEALRFIPEEQARAAAMVPFDLVKKTLYIAVKHPNNPATQDILQKIQDKDQPIQVYMCSEASLTHAWTRYADLVDTTAERHGVLSINPNQIEKYMQQLNSRESVAQKILEVRAINSAQRISDTIEIMFAGALSLGASDIHIEPEGDTVRLRYRLDGVLQDIIDLEGFVYNRVMSRLKLLSNMILNQRQAAQDGRFTFEIGNRLIEVRSSVIPGASGESIVMRLLDPTVASFNMENLDLSPQLLKIMQEQLRRPNGLIITTGPTGSGKTTALYAYLRQVHTPEIKIITIENPVEYKVEGIVQTQVDEDYTFEKGLRAILRQDPDVIMVGEIRDRDVAETAIHAAQTGHLVFSTLHTNSAVGGFPRLIDLGVDARMIGSSVNIILGQRLIRVLCQNCKEAYQASAEEFDLVQQVMASHPFPSPIPNPLTLYRSKGCAACNSTGFTGRVGVHEGIVVDEAVEDVVIRDPREHVILQAAASQKIPRMEHDGIDKVLAGVSSLSEVERVVDLAAALAQAKKIIHKDTADESLDTDFSEHII